MSDIELTHINSGYNLNKMNSNFDKIEDVVNDDILHRAGGNNTMRQALDMNSNPVINGYTDVTDPKQLLTVEAADARYVGAHGGGLISEWPLRGTKVVSDSTYTLTEEDNGFLINFTANPATVIVPDGADKLPVGFWVEGIFSGGIAHTTDHTLRFATPTGGIFIGADAFYLDQQAHKIPTRCPWRLIRNSATNTVANQCTLEVETSGDHTVVTTSPAQLGNRSGGQFVVAGPGTNTIFITSPQISKRGINNSGADLKLIFPQSHTIEGDGNPAVENMVPYPGAPAGVYQTITIPDKTLWSICPLDGTTNGHYVWIVGGQKREAVQSGNRTITPVDNGTFFYGYYDIILPNASTFPEGFKIEGVDQGGMKLHTTGLPEGIHYHQMLDASTPGEYDIPLKYGEHWEARKFGNRWTIKIVEQDSRPWVQEFAPGPGSSFTFTPQYSEYGGTTRLQNTTVQTIFLPAGDGSAENMNRSRFAYKYNFLVGAGGANFEAGPGATVTLLGGVQNPIPGPSRAVIEQVDINDWVVYVSGIGYESSSFDHGQLQGLADDDHPQYYNQTRGDARYVQNTALAQPSGVATLDASGKLLNSQIPAVAISDTFVVASEAAMLALTAETGDVAVRTDESKSYILTASNPAVLANWQELLSPTDSVGSVNGQTGAVVLDADDIDDTSTAHKFASAVELSKLSGIEAGAQVNTVTSVATKTGAVTLVKGDVGLGNVDNTSDLAKPISTATQTALDDKVDDTDPRLSDSREWTASTVSQAEAEAGTATTRRAWTAQRVRQAIAAWWNTITLTKADITDFNEADYATGAEGDLAASAVQPGDNVSDLVNDAGYITSSSVVTDHSALTGLGDDDHTQYYNQARGDARYAQRSNNLSDLSSASTARTNLGLGSVDNLSMLAHGLGTTSFVGGLDLSAINRNQFFAHYNVNGDADWDSGALGQYPMGIHWQRSTLVQAQMAIGYAGRMAYRVKTLAGAWSPWRRVWDSDNLNGAATTILTSNLTANRAMISNGSGKAAISAVTATELGYVSGVTSNIQAQIDAISGGGSGGSWGSITGTLSDQTDLQNTLNAKQNTITGAASTVTTSNLTPDMVTISNSSGKLASGGVYVGELVNLIGTTGNIQTQLDERATKTLTVTLATSNRTLALSDNNAVLHKNTAATPTYTIPQNSTVALPTGFTVTIVNSGGTGNVTISPAGAAVLTQAGTGTLGTVTLAPMGMVTLIKVATDLWFINGAGIV